MGLTVIRKSRGSSKSSGGNVALVLAGGAISGGAFKVGGLKALDDFLVDRKITDFDTYVGISAGSLLATAIAAGLTPAELIKVLDGSSSRVDQLRPIDFYNPNLSEFALRPAKLAYDLATYLPGLAADFSRGMGGLPDAVGPTLRRFVREPRYSEFEALVVRLFEHVAPQRRFPDFTNHVPSGFFDNASLARWVHRSLLRLRLPDEFAAFERATGRNLHITACNLDTAEREVFSARDHADVPISDAVQASSALPIFYKPARIDGVDYVDGGVRHTANIDIAIDQGADLIVCYNPFRPFLNRIDDEPGTSEYFSDGRYLSDRGMKLVVNQVFRTLLHSRLELGMQRYLNDDSFRGDIVLIEPRERDANFFSMNPLAFWRRSEAVRHGFESVRTTIEQNFDELEAVFRHHGIGLDRRAARRRATRIRRAQGWGPSAVEPTRRGRPSDRDESALVG